MEHNQAYLLMMEVLDGELADGAWADLESHLRACPSCRHEWHALQTIDSLFRQAPMLKPAADFTQRTLARLPNRHARAWAIGVIYVLLLMSGTMPLLLVTWAGSTLLPILREPAFFSGLLRLADTGLQAIGAVLRALLSGLGELVIQQPAILGWLLVMAGIVFVWNGLFRQFLNQPVQLQQGEAS